MHLGLLCSCLQCTAMSGGDEQPCVRITSHALRGKILVATRALHAGQTILEEEPVILVPASETGGTDTLMAYEAFCRCALRRVHWEVCLL